MLGVLWFRLDTSQEDLNGRLDNLYVADSCKIFIGTVEVANLYSEINNRAEQIKWFDRGAGRDQ